MKRLHATKTSLYKLVAEYVPDLPPMRTKTQFIKYYRSTSYALEWSTPNGDNAHAFFSTSMGYPLLAIEIRDWETGKTIRQKCQHDLYLYPAGTEDAETRTGR